MQVGNVLRGVARILPDPERQRLRQAFGRPLAEEFGQRIDRLQCVNLVQQILHRLQAFDLGHLVVHEAAIERRQLLRFRVVMLFNLGQALEQRTNL